MASNGSVGILTVILFTLIKLYEQNIACVEFFFMCIREIYALHMCISNTLQLLLNIDLNY